jgi:uncharacterized protein YyaL (SSP411 family)
VFRRVGIVISIAGMGAGLALSPVLPAGASKGGLCALNKQAEAVSTKAETNMTKAIESGNWATVKKDLLAAISQESGAEKTAIAALSSAPGKVQSAGAVMIRFAGNQKSIIQNANSLTKFESSEQAAEESPKIANAEKVLSAYYVSKCGPITPTT